MRFAPILLAATLLGCSKASTEYDVPRVSANTVSGNGTIVGKVMFDAPRPERKVIKNQPCTPTAPKELLEESAIVNENGTLKNAVVYIKNGPKTHGKDLAPARLDQNDCQYVPHVVGLVVGQPLTLHSSDTTPHNIHYQSAFSGNHNFLTTGADESIQTSFKGPEFVRTTCDIHPWMNAQIAVMDNPFFAITGDDGTFEIKNIPDGQYILAVWHERYGPQEKPVEIKGGKVEETFTYSAPK